MRNQKTILLVEDEVIIALAEKKTLEKYGYKVFSVSTGEKAVETVEKKSDIDLILMDIDLGKGMDGTEAAEIILKYNDVPVVFLSSHTESEIVEKTEGITSYGYVVKNSGETVLDASIKMAFKLFEERQEVNRQRKYLERMGSLAKIGPWEYNLHDSKLYWSKEVYNIFDLTDTAEINLDKALTFYTGESSKLIIRAINLAIEEGKSFMRDSEIITASGKRKWIRTQGEVFYSVCTGSKYIFGTIQDISKTRLLDRVTQESELTLNQIEEITHVGHWSVNTIDGSFYHSDEIKRIFGYEPSEYALSVEEAINAYHPEDRDVVMRLFNRAVETGEGYEFDLRVIQPSGDVRDVHSRGYAEQGEDGKVTRVYGVFQDITEQKRAEEAFRMAQFCVDRSAFEVYWIKEDAGFAYVNDKACRSLGYTSEELLKLKVPDVDPDFPMVRWEEHWEDLKEQKSFKIETRHQRKDGTTFPVEVTANYLEFRGKMYNFAFASDITERKNTLEKVTSFAGILEDSLNEIYIFDSETLKFLQVNRGARNNLGYTMDELSELTPLDLKPFFTPEQFQEIIDEIRKDRKIKRFETVHKRKNGSLYPVEVHLQFSVLGANPVFVAIILDITERKQAEEEIRQSKILLESSIESSGDMIILSLDREYRYLYFNKFHAETMNHVYGTQPRIGDCIFDHMKGDDDIEMAKVHYARGLAGDSHVIIGEYGEGQARYFYETQYNLIYDSEKEIIGVTAFARNVTERKQAEEKLQKSFQQNKDLLSELQHRAKNSFHMLSSMIGLMEKEGMSDETKLALSDIRSRIRAVSEIYDLLHETSSVTELRLDQYIDRLASNLSYTLENITLTQKVDAVTISVRKAIPIGLIIVELITNSIKYAFPDNIKGEITLSLKKAKQNAVIEVSDNGKGLPDGFDISDIDSMGLMLVNALVVQIDGNFKIESKKGTRCIVEFKLEDTSS
ncbi:PAS domain S-box protein [Spirochaetota bacterium]